MWTSGASSTDIKDMPDCFVLQLAEQLAGVRSLLLMTGQDKSCCASLSDA